MFSKNESHEEIATDNLKYLMLPYFIGQLTLKLCVVDRLSVVNIAEIYFKDYLKRCEDYELCTQASSAITKATEIVAKDEIQRLTQMAQQRNQKLQKYQQKKELDDQIKNLKIAMNKEHIEEEIKRNFYMKLLKACIWQAQDEISSLEQEKEILVHIDKMREENPDYQRPKHAPKTTPLKPIIITKDILQKAIYGLGYPSMPTFTVEEFYNQRVADGIFPTNEQMKESQKNSIQNRTDEDTALMEEKEAEENELKVELDDEETLERARAKDEFKDDHRRGYGNRYNRS